MNILPLSLEFNQNNYYIAEELKVYNPAFFYGTCKSINHIIKRKKIPLDDLLYVNKINDEWIICDNTLKNAKLLLTKTWVDTYFFSQSLRTNTDTIINKKKKNNISLSIMPNIINDNDNINDNKEEQIILQPDVPILQPDVPILQPDVPILQNNNIIITNNNTEEEKEIIIFNENAEKEELVEAPEILELTNDEKFKNSYGQILNIEVRGERGRKNIFFKLKDIIKIFNMPSLESTLIQKTSGYTRNLDYIYFKYKITKKRIYLTYHGLIRLLYVSRNETVKYFQDWAEHKLFTIQIGCNKDKLSLAADILKIDLKTQREVLKTYASKISGIYLFSLGNVKDLRNTFNIDINIDDTLEVCKYGRSEDLRKRLGDHDNTYGKLQNVKTDVLLWIIVDEKHLSKAEKEVRDFCNNGNKNLVTQGEKELVLLSKKDKIQIKTEYENIGKKYSGATEELQNEVILLRNIIKEHEHKYTILEKDMIIQKQELTNVIQKLECEIKYKDLELSTIKTELGWIRGENSRLQRV